MHVCNHQIAPYHSQKFMVLDSSVSVDVKGLEEGANIVRGDFHFEVSARFFELLPRQTVRPIIVNDLENSLQTYDAFCTSLEDLFTENVH